MKKRKIITSVGLAAVLAFSGQFLPSASLGGLEITGIRAAEAGLPFGLGDIAKKAGKEAVSKALNVDIDGMEDKRQNMMLNLYRSAVNYAYASAHVQEALLADGGNSARIRAAIGQVTNNKSDFGSIKSLVEASSINEKDINAAAKAKLDSGDTEAIQKANELIQQAKTERKSANIYKILAARDAISIVKDAGVALTKGGDSIKDKVNVLEDLAAVAKNAETLTKVISAQHKGMTGALKTYEKKNNIKDVSDEEAKKQTANLTEE